MSKSLGNMYTIKDLEDRGIDPVSMRLLFLQTHYRKNMTFTWESVFGAHKAYRKLKEIVLRLRETANPNHILSPEAKEYQNKFVETISNDLQIPQAVAIMWEMLDSNLSDSDKLMLLYDFDRVLGFGLKEIKEEPIPEEIIKLGKQREEAKKNKDYELSDLLRQEIEGKGYSVEDTDVGMKFKKLDSKKQLIEKYKGMIKEYREAADNLVLVVEELENYG